MNAERLQQHVDRVEAAGCLHPPYYELINDTTVLGWCKLCRADLDFDEPLDDPE